MEKENHYIIHDDNGWHLICPGFDDPHEFALVTRSDIIDFANPDQVFELKLQEHMEKEHKAFEFTREEDGSLSKESAIFQALGAASLCWSESPKGIFDSTRAKEIGDALVAELNHQERANLGYATTGELLDELSARIDVDYYSGGGGLGYTTVYGRP